METRQKKLYIDVLRIMATCMMLYNHTSTFGFSLYTVNTEGILYWIYLFIAVFVKTTVPIFFMISGALLLSKEETVEQVVKKRFLRFAVVLLTGSLIHYFYFTKCQVSVMSVKDFVKMIFAGNLVTPYWYLYSYMGFLLMLPILRKLAQGLQTQGYVYLIGMFFLVKCLQVAEFVVWKGSVEHSPYFSFFIMGDNIFYPLLGYFIEYRLPQKFYEKKYVCLAIVSSVVAVSFCCVLTFLNSCLTNLWDEGNTQGFFHTFIFIPAGSVYFCAKYWFSKHQPWEWLVKLISTVGACTFGVYLFETIYREETKQVFWMLLPYFPALIACVIWILCAFVVGVGVTYILKKIPLIKWLL